MDDEVVLTGHVVSLKQFKPNGWGTLKFTYKDGVLRKTGTAVGNVGGLHNESPIEIRGVWESHHKYGMQFKFSMAFETDFTAGSVLDWLILRFPNIGQVRGRAMLQRFAYDDDDEFCPTKLWGVVENETEMLCLLDGINYDRAFEIRAAYLKYKTERETFLKLARLGLTKTEVLRVIEAFERPDGDEVDVMQEIGKNPYVLYTTFEVLTFLKVDEMSKRLGLSRTDPNRIEAGVTCWLRIEATEGHTVVDQDTIKSEVANFLDLEPSDVMEELRNVEAFESVCTYEFGDGQVGYALVVLAAAERDIAYQVKLLQERNNVGPG